MKLLLRIGLWTFGGVSDSSPQRICSYDDGRTNFGKTIVQQYDELLLEVIRSKMRLKYLQSGGVRSVVLER